MKFDFLIKWTKNKVSLFVNVFYVVFLVVQKCFHSLILPSLRNKNVIILPKEKWISLCIMFYFYKPLCFYVNGTYPAKLIANICFSPFILASSVISKWMRPESCILFKRIKTLRESTFYYSPLASNFDFISIIVIIIAKEKKMLKKKFMFSFWFLYNNLNSS